MPAIVLPEPVALIKHADRFRFGTEEYAAGREGRFVLDKGRATYHDWLKLSASLIPQHEEEEDELPPVKEFPIVQTVMTRFYEAGRLMPLPFPDSDD